MMYRYCKNLVPVISRGHHALIVMMTTPKQIRSFWNFPHFSDFRTVLRDMDRHMEHVEREIFRTSPVLSMTPRSLPVDFIEPTGNTYRISIDATGFKPEDIKVSLKDRVLTVEAKMENKSEDGSRLYQEIRRVYTLPEHVEGSKLKSLLTSNGILSIEAPISDEETKVKEIPITHAENIAAK